MGRYYRVTISSEETIELGIQIGQLLLPGDCVFCLGELGVGKTELIRGISQGIFGNTNNSFVASPSFNYVNTYQNNKQTVHHFDLYRIEDIKHLSNLGFEELLFSDAISCVEWPSLLKDVITQNVLQIELVFNHDFSRKIMIDTHLFRKNIDLSHMFRMKE